jgi:hypothetical protein
MSRNTEADTPMHQEYVKLIAELDQVLELVSALFGAAKEHGEKAKWRHRIDGLLDERLRLMAARDAAAQFAAVKSRLLAIIFPQLIKP